MAQSQTFGGLKTMSLEDLYVLWKFASDLQLLHFPKKEVSLKFLAGRRGKRHDRLIGAL